MDTTLPEWTFLLCDLITELILQVVLWETFSFLVLKMRYSGDDLWKVLLYQELG